MGANGRVFNCREWWHRGSPARRAALAGVALALLVVPTRGQAMPERARPSARLLASLADPETREFVAQVLERNPRVAAAAAQARASRLQAPQARALPDPTLAATAYVSPPESRVGPQNWMASLSQRLPWFGKLGLQERAAEQRTDALEARVEIQRLELVTEARLLLYEVAFLDTWSGTLAAERQTLVHYEALARARYASGAGFQQAVIRIQAEITRADARLLELGGRRASLVAELNALRDLRPGGTLGQVGLPEPRPVRLDRTALRAGALSQRPELEQADSELERAKTAVQLARKDYQPDVTLGISYTRVGRRDDLAGLAQPPADNGQDVFAVTASINLPIRRAKLRAGVEQAAQLQRVADEGKRGALAAIDRALDELSERTELSFRQWRLLNDVLGVQADQSLRAAEAAYAAGSLNSLDLLDAERVLFDVRTATARAQADYAIVLARLEGAVGGPLDIEEGVAR